MRTVLRASVRIYARRYVAAVIAVVVGVAFILVTAAVSSSTKSGLLAGVSQAYQGADVVVINIDSAAAQQTLSRTTALGPAAVNAQATVPVTVDGSPIPDVPVGTVADNSTLRWQKLESGRFPSKPGEAVVDGADARDNDVSVGGRLLVGSKEHQVPVTVTGLVEPSVAGLAASVYLTWPDLQHLGDSVLVTNVVLGSKVLGGGDSGGDVSVSEVRATGLPKYADAVSADQYLRDQAASVTRGVDAVSAMLLVFAAIALFVSVLVIANTFAVLLAQRMRDFALLRCVGATRKQVLRSLRQEALTIGAAASTLGVIVGLALGHALVALAIHFFPALPAGDIHISWPWIAASWLVGVLVTFVASVFPARRSTRIPPLAALRPQEGIDPRSRAGVLRLSLGVLLIAGGSAMLAYSVVEHTLLVMIGGGFLSFFGVLAFGPVLVPACIRVSAMLTSRLLGVPGRLAAANAVRNPRRTAATAASLLVGTTLITGMVTGMSTIRGSVDREMDQEYPIDISLTSASALPAGTADRLRAINGIDKVVSVSATRATLSQGKQSGETTVLGVPEDTSLLRGTHAFAHPRPHTAYVAWDTISDLGLDPGGRISLNVGGQRENLRISPTYAVKGTVLVSPALLDALTGGHAATRSLWARASDNVDADEAKIALKPLAKSVGAELGGGMANRAYVDLQLNVMVLAVVVLLGIALVIALIGIGNTLGLSVLERKREHALLRALGLTRTQLRGTLAVEAVLLAVVTSVIGIALGSLYAFIGVKAVLEEALGEAGVSLHVPVGQLLLVVVVAALAGLAACVLPARNAARVTPAAGLAVE